MSTSENVSLITPYFEKSRFIGFIIVTLSSAFKKIEENIKNINNFLIFPPLKA
jgi:hypothetical protein